MEQLIKSEYLQSNKNIKNFLIERLFLNLRNVHFYGEKPFELFLNLLDIKTEDTDGTYDTLLRGEKKVLTEFGSFEATIENIKDLRQNQLVLKLYNATSKNSELSLLSTFFNYLHNPSLKTLQELFYTIQSKMKIYGTSISIHSLQVNWQLEYIINKLHEKTSDKEILKTIQEWGNNFDEFLKYEEKINDVNDVFKNIDFISIDNKHNIDNDTSEINYFYEHIYKKNKLKLSDNLLWAFVFEYRKKKNDISKEIIKEIIKIINDDNDLLSWIKGPSLIYVIGSIDKNELMNLTIDYEFLNVDYPTSIVPPNAVLSAIKNIVDIIKFNQQESSFIKVAFDIVIKQRRLSLKNNIDYNIFFDLEYNDMELKTYGYLLSLIDPEIHTNDNKMERITKFLISRTESNSDIFKHVQTITKINILGGDLIEHLLLEMYRNIKKDSIEDCILASTYENYFQTIFENKVIEV